MHRAGLGGLACTLKYIERAYKNGDLAEKTAPGGPWQEGNPPWEIKPLEITLRFGKPENAGDFLKRLFACAFCIKERLIFLPAQHRVIPSVETLAELQNGLTLSFLQHGRVRQLAKKETPIFYEIDGQLLQISVKQCSGYKHQAGWKEFCSNGCLSDKPLEVVGPLNPGAVVRHVAFQAQTRIEEGPALVLPLYFALIGCVALPINKGVGALLVPEVIDLVTFSRIRPWMTPTGVRECRIAGGSDAALQAQVRLAASKIVQSQQFPGCHAVSFHSTPWASQQKSRVDCLYVPPCDGPRLRQFEVALAELPPRIIPKKKGQMKQTRKKNEAVEKIDKSEFFWADSVVRPLVANNLAGSRRWYQGFADLIRRSAKKVAFEKGGINTMINKIPWEDHGESVVVKAVHEAIRKRFGQIAEENKGKLGTMKNRWRNENDRWRLAFSGAKTAEQFRHSLCDLFGRAGNNSVLREKWQEVLPMLDARHWQLTRDLALLALASYKGKGSDYVAEAMEELVDEVENGNIKTGGDK